jgi:hypothetical protein
MKFALMAEPRRIGNDEPWNGIARHTIERQRQRSQNGKKMTISPSPTTVFANLKPARTLRWVFAAAALVAIAVPGAADASRGARGMGAYDGTWSVTFATRAGSCSSNTVPFNVAGTRVSSAGGGKVTGGVSRGGAVAVQISVGLSHASGSGRLVGNSGAGRWSGIISGDRCSGNWQATRS